MQRGRPRISALVLAPLLALAACEQIEDAVQRARGGAPSSGPAPLEQVTLEARAMAGSVQPQDQAAALLAPQPVRVVAGEILIGARAEAQVEQTVAQARDVLTRLGLEAEVKPADAGLVMVTLPVADAAVIEWNDADRCPILVVQRQLENDPALATRCAVQHLRASRRFAYVEPNYVAQAAQAGAASAVLPDDPLYPSQWGFHARGEGEGRSPGGAGFEPFWQAGFIGGSDVRVALLDTGLDVAHPDIAGGENVAKGIDLIADPQRAGDSDGVDENVQDVGAPCPGGADEFHGTRVASIIGAATTNNRAGIAGGAWSVGLIPVRVLGRCGGALSDIVAGVRWAAGLSTAALPGGRELAVTEPADIIVLPFVMQAACPRPLQDAIDAASARNIVVVAAAGNRASRTDQFAPANCANVLVVAAADARGDLAFYSNFGAEVDVLAPGGDMFADIDHDGRPDGVLTAATTQSGCYDPLTRASAQRCNYVFEQGASLAAAHVAAALALLAARDGLRGRALEQALLTTAVAPLPAGFGRIECARSRNAIPVAAGASLCDRPAGRGALDLSRALAGR